jgi:hypothetical protein
MKRQAVGPVPGYWCECVLYTPTAEFGTTIVDSFDATSAAEAVGWLRFYLSDLTETVSVAESDAARRWLVGGHATTLAAVAKNEPFSFWVSAGWTRVEWTIRPVLFLPLVISC